VPTPRATRASRLGDHGVTRPVRKNNALGAGPFYGRDLGDLLDHYCRRDHRLLKPGNHSVVDGAVVGVVALDNDGGWEDAVGVIIDLRVERALPRKPWTKTVS